MLNRNDSYAMTVGPTPVFNCEVVPCLRARDYKDPPLVFVSGVDLYNQTVTGDVAKTLNSISSDADHVPCVVQQRAMFWNGDDVVGCLTANNANGGQRMPDKDNFGCILVEVERACV